MSGFLDSKQISLDPTAASIRPVRDTAAYAMRNRMAEGWGAQPESPYAGLISIINQLYQKQSTPDLPPATQADPSLLQTSQPGGGGAPQFQIPGANPLAARSAIGPNQQGSGGGPMALLPTSGDVSSGSRLANAFQPSYLNQATAAPQVPTEVLPTASRVAPRMMSMMQGDLGDDVSVDPNRPTDPDHPDSGDGAGTPSGDDNKPDPDSDPPGDLGSTSVVGPGETTSEGIWSGNIFDRPVPNGPYAAPLVQGQLDALSGFQQMFDPSPIVQTADMRSALERGLGGNPSYDPGKDGDFKSFLSSYDQGSSIDPFLSSIFGGGPSMSPTTPGGSGFQLADFTPRGAAPTGGFQPNTGGGGAAHRTYYQPGSASRFQVPVDQGGTGAPVVNIPDGGGAQNVAINNGISIPTPQDVLDKDGTGQAFNQPNTGFDASVEALYSEAPASVNRGQDVPIPSAAGKYIHGEGFQNGTWTQQDAAGYFERLLGEGQPVLAREAWVIMDEDMRRNVIQNTLSAASTGRNDYAEPRVNFLASVGVPIQGLASGGKLDASGVNIVGEEGPEAIVKGPDGKMHVVPIETFGEFQKLKAGGASMHAEGGTLDFGGTQLTDAVLPDVAGSYKTALQPPRFDLTDTFKTANEVFQGDLSRGVATAKEEASAFGLNPGSSDRMGHLARTAGDISSRHRLGLLDRANQSFESAEQRRLGALGLAPSVTSATDLPFQRKLQAAPLALARDQQTFDQFFRTSEASKNREMQALSMMPSFYNLPFQTAEALYGMGEQARGTADTEIMRYLDMLTRNQGAGLNEVLAMLSGTPLNNTAIEPSMASQFGQLLAGVGGLIPSGGSSIVKG